MKGGSMAMNGGFMGFKPKDMAGGKTLCSRQCWDLLPSSAVLTAPLQRFKLEKEVVEAGRVRDVDGLAEVVGLAGGPVHAQGVVGPALDSQGATPARHSSTLECLTPAGAQTYFLFLFFSFPFFFFFFISCPDWGMPGMPAREWAVPGRVLTPLARRSRQRKAAATRTGGSEQPASRYFHDVPNCRPCTRMHTGGRCQQMPPLRSSPPPFFFFFLRYRSDGQQQAYVSSPTHPFPQPLARSAPDSGQVGSVTTHLCHRLRLQRALSAGGKCLYVEEDGVHGRVAHAAGGGTREGGAADVDVADELHVEGGVALILRVAHLDRHPSWCQPAPAEAKGSQLALGSARLACSTARHSTARFFQSTDGRQQVAAAAAVAAPTLTVFWATPVLRGLVGPVAGVPAGVGLRG